MCTNDKGESVERLQRVGGWGDIGSVEKMWILLLSEDMKKCGFSVAIRNLEVLGMSQNSLTFASLTVHKLKLQELLHL